MIASEESLSARLAALKARHPHAYPRDYAALMGISEGELTPIFYPERALELFDLEAILTSVAGLSRVKLMARTAFAVFELFTRVDFRREGQILELSSPSCSVALATNELGKIYFLSPASEKEKAAILIFDKSGAAALKLYLEAHEFNASLLTAEAKSAGGAASDLGAFLDKSRHTSAPVNAANARELIESAATRQGRLGFELRTPAIAVYITHKPVKVVDARGWFNILDEDFNLHLKEEAVLKTETGAALSLTGDAGEAIKLWRLK